MADWLDCSDLVDALNRTASAVPAHRHNNPMVMSTEIGICGLWIVVIVDTMSNTLD